MKAIPGSELVDQKFGELVSKLDKVATEVLEYYNSTTPEGAKVSRGLQLEAHCILRKIGIEIEEASRAKLIEKFCQSKPRRKEIVETEWWQFRNRWESMIPGFVSLFQPKFDSLKRDYSHEF